MFGEVARGEASLRPGQGEVAPDAPRAGEQDVAVVGLADVAHRLEPVGHVGGVGDVLVAPGASPMHGAVLDEHLDHALAEARCDVAPDVALGHRVVVVLDTQIVENAQYRRKLP